MRINLFYLCLLNLLLFFIVSFFLRRRKKTGQVGLYNISFHGYIVLGKWKINEIFYNHKLEKIWEGFSFYSLFLLKPSSFSSIQLRLAGTMVDLISQNQPSSLDAFIINFQTWVQFVVRTLPMRLVNKGLLLMLLLYYYCY